MKVTQSQVAQVSIAGRCSPESTEIIPSIAGLDLPEFWLELWGSAGGERSKIGYAKFELATANVTSGVTEGTYQLAQLLPAGAQPPRPIVSMSGVLWTRHAALEADQRIQSFQRQEGWMPGCGPRGFV